MAQPAHLAAWQADRRERKRKDVREAIRRLDARGVAMSFAVVAEEAGVDRSWIYSQQDLADQIRRMRHDRSAPLQQRPQAERASAASLRVRLAAAHHSLTDARKENDELRAEIRALRQENSRLRGELWERPPRG